MTPVAITRRAVRIRPAHVREALRALGWLVAVRIALKLRGFAGMRALLRLAPAAEPAAAAMPALPQEARRACSVAQRVAARASCLPRSAVVERALRAHGVPAQIVLGVDTADGFRAHAWVEVDGFIVGSDERGSEAWKTVARFERSAR